MNDVSFWRIIECGGRAARDPDTKLSRINRLLWKKPTAELRQFQRLLHRKLAAAYNWDLFGAATLMVRDCAVDQELFFHFCEWLVAQGRAVYETALAEPDNLADLKLRAEGVCLLEGLWRVAQDVYEERKDSDMPEGRCPFPKAPAGESWDVTDADQLQRRLPKLFGKYRVSVPEPPKA